MRRIPCRPGAALVLVAVLGAPLLVGCGASTVGGDDASVVFCLSPQQRPALAQAAVTLRLAQPDPGGLRVGPDRLSLDTWRDVRTDDFERACRAIAPPPAADPLTTNLVAVANVVAGGLIALVSAALTAGVARRRQLADAVRGAARSVAGTVEGMVRERLREKDTGPSLDTLLERIAVLESALLRARSASRAPGYVDGVVGRAGDLPDTFAQPWTGTPERLEGRAQGARDAAARLDRDAEAVAVRVERYVRLPWNRPPAAAVGGR